MRGLIALDIDGTITNNLHALDGDVVDYFSSLVSKGWEFVFITGRPYSVGFPTLEHLPFPYYFAVQNGALVLQMPEKKIVSKRYLDRRVLGPMEKICHGEKSDYIIYGGFEVNDVCYYRPDHFDPELLEYLKNRCKVMKETWKPVDNFDSIPLESFPSVKCFGDYASGHRIADRIEAELGLHAPVIKDRFPEPIYVIQATEPTINKGEALKICHQLLGGYGPVIAGGDDLNDLPMMKMADISVVMSTAPQSLLDIADIIAPPAHSKGIIQGLEQAIKRVNT